MDADELYKRAYGAVERGNPDYAIELFTQILDFFPDHVQARKALRATEIKKAEQAGYSKFTGVLAFIKGFDVAIKIVFLTMQKKYEKSMGECERYLLRDPKSVWALKTLGQCAAKGGYPGAAQVAFENILSINKKHAGALEGLARMYEEQEDFEQATKHLSRLKIAKPNDRGLEKWMRDLAARGTMKKGQWEKTDSSFRDKLKDKDAAVKLEDKQQMVRTDEDVDRAIERLQTDLEKKPDDNRLWRELGDMYRRRRAFAKAFEAYSRCLKNDPSDSLAKARIGDMRIQQYEEKIEKLQAVGASSEAKAQIEKLRAEHLQFSVHEFRRRVKEMPTDLNLKFSLGKLLRQNGEVDEAISCFQASVEETRLKVDALLELGACFSGKGQHDLAVRQYSLANDEISGMNQRKKEVLYRLGLVCHAAGRDGDARDHFTQIYEVDINFKDVAKRLESLGPAAT